MSPDIVRELAPTGALRAGINLSNFLLVSRVGPAGEPEGVAPDLAREIADRLSVPVKYVPFRSPGELVDQAARDVWDIGLIGAEPQRAALIAFTAAYVEIAATYLVPAASSLHDVTLQDAADVDAPGVRIAYFGRSAYGLWLERNIKHAELLPSASHDSARDQFVGEKLEALAGLKPRLLTDVEELPGTRMVGGQFTAIQQAVGTERKNVHGAAFLSAFVEEAKASGLIARLIERHKVSGLSVAPPA
jgi:polar amino acid transport system substrate-binding protein